FWELHWNAKRSGGGFIWAMIDESVARTDFNNMLDANGLNANDGILGPHREKERRFSALREIFSPVKISIKNLPDNFDGTIRIENRYHFTNINQCRFRWELVNYYLPYDRFTGYMVEQKGEATTGSILLAQTGTLSLKLPADHKKYDALVLAAYDPDGKEIYKWIWKLKNNEALLANILVKHDSATSFAETDTT